MSSSEPLCEMSGRGKLLKSFVDRLAGVNRRQKAIRDSITTSKANPMFALEETNGMGELMAVCEGKIQEANIGKVPIVEQQEGE